MAKLVIDADAVNPLHLDAILANHPIPRLHRIQSPGLPRRVLYKQKANRLPIRRPGQRIYISMQMAHLLRRITARRPEEDVGLLRSRPAIARSRTVREERKLLAVWRPRRARGIARPRVAIGYIADRVGRDH